MLLQDISDCWSPDGWLPVTQGSQPGRSQRMQPAQGSYPSACLTPQASRKRSSSSVEPSTAGQHLVQVPHADIQNERLPARHLSTRTPACDSRQSHNTDEHAGDSTAVTSTCRALSSVPELTDTSRGGDIPRPEAAPLPAVAHDPAHVSQAAAAVETDAAHDRQEAPAPEADNAPAHDNQEIARVTDDAAAMAAWLMQKPSLLQGVLGHLESLAAGAVGADSSIQTHASDRSAELGASSNARHPPAGLVAESSNAQETPARLVGASSNARDKPSLAGACDAQHQFSLPGASHTGMQASGQLLSCSSASASRQDCHQQAAAQSLPSQTDACPVTAIDHKPQHKLVSQHKASADAAVQQSGNGSQQVSHSKAGVCSAGQQEAACARLQQDGAWHCHSAFDLQGTLVEGWPASGKDASCPDPVPVKCRALLEHCAAGR